MERTIAQAIITTDRLQMTENYVLYQSPTGTSSLEGPGRNSLEKNSKIREPPYRRPRRTVENRQKYHF